MLLAAFDMSYGMFLPRQQNDKGDAPGMHFAGAVLQHLVGAKLDCTLGNEKCEHNSFFNCRWGRVAAWATFV